MLATHARTRYYNLIETKYSSNNKGDLNMFSSSGQKVEKFSKTNKQSRQANGRNDDSRKRNKTARGGKEHYEDY